MDNLFKTRTLTRSMNYMRRPGGRLFQRYFAPKLNWQPGSRIAFDILSTSETVLSTVANWAPAHITTKESRKTVTMEAPRLAEKLLIRNSEIEDMRRYGALGPELLSARIAREQQNLRDKFDRTLEFWAAYTLRGKIVNGDLAEVLYDYGLPATHAPVLTTTDLWSDFTNSDPISDIREWKRLIEDECGAAITSWTAICGWKTMDTLLNHTKLQNLLTYALGRQIAEEGRIAQLSGVSIEEYNGSFISDVGVRTRYILPNAFLLIGSCDDAFDCPYCAAVSDDENTPQLFYSDSWQEKDPKGRWIFGEARAFPALKRPEVIVDATVVAAP